MRVDLHHAQIGIAPGMSSDGSERSRMLTGQGDDEPPSADVRSDKRVDRIYSLSIDFAVKIEGASCGHSSPLAIWLAPECFVV
jgi:hypothetical protein